MTPPKLLTPRRRVWPRAHRR